jgi:hypothetical protein
VLASDVGWELSKLITIATTYGRDKENDQIVGNRPRHDQSKCRNSIKFHKADVDARCFGADIRQPFNS